MKSIKSVFCLLIVVFSYTLSVAQGNYRDNDRDHDRNRDRNRVSNIRRLNRCNSPFPMSSFNRDFNGLSGTSYYHLDRELKEYSRLHCLTSEQIMRLAMLYPNERERYDYLSYSLPYVFDFDNYASTASIFTNFNTRDAYLRFLLKQGVPTGDYFANAGYAQGGYYASNGAVIAPPPQYYDRNGNPVPMYDNRAGVVTPAPQYYDRNGNPVPMFDNRDVIAPAPQYYDRNGNPINGMPNNNGYNNYPSQATQPNTVNNSKLLSYKDFDIIKNKIAQIPSDNGKLDLAKQMARENQLTANQIAEITRLLNYDANRLDYAKFALDYVYDRENYAVVSEAMSYEVNKKDLIQYIESRKR